jgi:RNA polymerase sigma factor (sigma-70 family)
MSEPRSDPSLVGLWRTGDEQAAQQLFERYADRLLRLASRHLSQRMARRVDPEDIVHSVFRTFFVRARDGQFTVEGPDDLGKLLTRMTLIKVLRQVQRHRAARRDVTAEAEPGPDADDPAANVLAREPGPEVMHAFLDQLTHFLTRLSPQERQILELKLDGYSSAEIAEKLGSYERKVNRVLERIRALAEQENLGDVEPTDPPG